MPTLDMKVCTKCNQELPATLEYFYLDSQKKDFLYSSCKQCKAVNDKEYQTKNKDSVSLKNKQYYIKNADQIKKKSLQYKKDYPESSRRSWHKREALKKENMYEFYTEKEVFETYGTNCYLCDMPINLQVSGQAGSNPQWRSGLHIEHFVSSVKGGSTTLENLRPSHAWCNLSKGIK